MKECKKTEVKPFLKWAGGKGQLLETFQKFYPEELKTGRIKNYYEPFVGAGAVFFDLVQNYRISNATLSDNNDELILCWQVVQKDVHRLLEMLEKLQKRYRQCSPEKQMEFYYETRIKFNQNRLQINYSEHSAAATERAAQIIFLNKTCFNGLFRFNQKGEFNVPAGRYKNPKILDEQNLIQVSEVLSDVVIKKADFSQVEQENLENAFVYFDPPYRPISKTSSFKSYSKNTFNDENQRELAELYSRLHQKQVRLMLSNSDPKNYSPDDNFFDELYADFHISRVPAKRAINSKAGLRFAINEIIVTNYPAI